MSDAEGRPLPFPTGIQALDADGLRRLGQAYLASLPTPPVGKTRITDKTPCNFLYVGLIRLILPNARIIHTMRNPVDTCVSCFSRLFTFGSDVQFRPGRVGSLLPLVPRVDGTLAIGFASRRQARRLRTRRWSTTSNSKPGG